VYLQVDGGTGSASEFLVNILKSSGRVTMYGKRTPGALLTALPHQVGDGFIVTVPEADYFTEAGTRIEGNGIWPDVVVDDPHTAVMEEIRKTMPYPATLMLATLAYNRRQFAAAEKYWIDAKALASTDAERQVIDRRIAQARKAKEPH
jgi:C-terminal processing protease CtpA/Prc